MMHDVFVPSSQRCKDTCIIPILYLSVEALKDENGIRVYKMWTLEALAKFLKALKVYTHLHAIYISRQSNQVTSICHLIC